jgi:hypothetical protein
MKVQKYGEYNPKQKVKFSPVGFIERRVLISLDHLLAVLFQYNPAIQRLFIDKLISKIKPLITTNYVKSKSIDITKMLDKMDNLKNYPELAELMFNLSIKFCKLPQNVPWENVEIEILDGNIARGYSFPLYYQVLVLAEVAGKDKASDLYKKHQELFREKHQQIQKFEDLDAVREFFIKGAQNWGNVLIISEVTDGKLIVRRDHCLYSEVLREFNDPEITSLILCSGDFSYWKATNPDFVLTRQYTLMESHSYCDFVFHDKRINDEIIHPSQEFFDTLLRG